MDRNQKNNKESRENSDLIEKDAMTRNSACETSHDETKNANQMCTTKLNPRAIIKILCRCLCSLAQIFIDLYANFMNFSNKCRVECQLNSLTNDLVCGYH